jgi:hypothetical protein
MVWSRQRHQVADAVIDASKTLRKPREDDVRGA